MRTEYLPSFLKDLKSLKSSQSFESIQLLVFEEIPNCSGIDEIKNLKKLKDGDNAFRVRIGDYRIGLLIEDDVITFARVLHRKEIYRYFP